MFRSFVPCALALGLAAGPALAQTGAGAPAQTTVPATTASGPPANAPSSAKPTGADPDKQVICKHQEELGSRLGGKRVCMTRAQWAQQAQDAQASSSASQRAPR